MLYANIKKDFGDFSLDVEFETNKETLSLFGASGCGKSMTLKCIAGIVKPDKGEIVLNGKTLFNSKKKINLLSRERNVGLLFQNYALFPNMTLRQNLEISLPKGKKASIDLIDEKIQDFSLNGLENNYPHQLSGGQQQRVALARMLLNEPAILMFDEPFSALDEHLRWQMEQKLILVLKESNVSTLYVSHNKDEVFRISDRVAVLNNGSIEEIDTKESIFSNPKTLNGAMLTGCKNISRVKKISDKKVFAYNWDIELDTDTYVGEDINHIGIHTHNLYISNDEQGENVFEFDILDILESFSAYTLVLCSAKRQSCDSENYIYLDLAKDENFNIKDKSSIYLEFKKKHLLLLK